MRQRQCITSQNIEFVESMNPSIRLLEYKHTQHTNTKLGFQDVMALGSKNPSFTSSKKKSPAWAYSTVGKACVSWQGTDTGAASRCRLGESRAMPNKKAWHQPSGSLVNRCRLPLLLIRSVTETPLLFPFFFT
jgi:hypothetical protein